MNDVIVALDDATAIRVLDTFARARLPADDSGPQLTPDVRQALGVWSEAALLGMLQPVSAGDLARQALLALTTDPQNVAGLTALIQSPAPQRYGVVTSIAVTTLALTVLQIHIKFERGKDGKISFKIEKKAAPPALLKTLAQMLSRFVSSNGAE